MLVDLTDVSCHQSVGVVEAPGADATIMQLHHEAVTRDELHQHLLTEELEGGKEGRTQGPEQEGRMEGGRRGRKERRRRR